MVTPVVFMAVASSIVIALATDMAAPYNDPKVCLNHSVICHKHPDNI